MTRPTLLAVALLALAGCQAENRAAPPDPFLFGPTRVPPPATGTVTPPPGLSSNRPAATAAVLPPASDMKSLAVVAAPAPAFGSSVQVPAAGVAVAPVGDQVKIPDAARKLDAPDRLVAGGTLPSSQPAAPPSTASTAPGAAISGSGSPSSSPAVADRRSDPLPSGQERVVQTLLPRSQATATPSPFPPGGSARPLQAPATSGGNKSNVVDMDDLPAATPTGQPQTSYHPSTIQLVSGTEEKGTVPICGDQPLLSTRPEGAPHKWGLFPFSPAAVMVTTLSMGGCEAGWSSPSLIGIGNSVTSPSTG